MCAEAEVQLVEPVEGAVGVSSGLVLGVVSRCGENSWRDSQPQGAGGGRWARVWGGDATSLLWARRRSTVVGVNCCVVGGAIGVVVVGGSIGLIVVVSFQWGKWVVVACCPCDRCI